MKIRINYHSVVCRTKVTTTCLAGTSYYSISYLLDGECVYSIQTKALNSQPSPIEYLDMEFEKNSLCSDCKASGYYETSDGQGRRRQTKTHREWLVEALNQLEPEEENTIKLQSQN